MRGSRWMHRWLGLRKGKGFRGAETLVQRCGRPLPLCLITRTSPFPSPVRPHVPCCLVPGSPTGVPLGCRTRTQRGVGQHEGAGSARPRTDLWVGLGYTA